MPRRHPVTGDNLDAAVTVDLALRYATEEGPARLAPRRVALINRAVRLAAGHPDRAQWLTTRINQLVDQWETDDAATCHRCGEPRIAAADRDTWTCLCPGGDA